MGFRRWSGLLGRMGLVLVGLDGLLDEPPEILRHIGRQQVQVVEQLYVDGEGAVRTDGQATELAGAERTERWSDALTCGDACAPGRPPIAGTPFPRTQVRPTL